MTVNLAIDDRVPGHVFRYVERELYDYPVNRELCMDYLKRRNDELTRGRQQPEGEAIRAEGTPSDPTLGKAIRLLALEHRAERALFYVQAIDSVMATLNEQDKRLVKRKYFDSEEVSNEVVADELSISRAQFYNVRQGIIRKFALRFGIL